MPKTVVLTYLALLSRHTWAACNPDTNPDGCIDVTCRTDDTLVVNIGYYHQADILEIAYGNCTADDIDGADQQNSTELSWELTFPIERCNMGGNLRSIQYVHTATVHVGIKQEVGPAISLAHFEIDAFCEFKNTYELIFDYGTVDTTMEKFDDEAGKISVDIRIKSYTSDYSSEDTTNERAGTYTYLGITIDDDNFNHAASLWGSDVGKIFTPRKCIVEDVENGYSYLLFDMELGCSNDEIELAIGWKQDKNMWTISHILFLLGEITESTFQLRCMFHVCDVAHDTSTCAIAVAACFAVNGNWTDYGPWSTCTAACGNGTQYRSRSCTNPTPDFAGKTCQGSTEETQQCNMGDCDPSFDLASVNECATIANCANGHQCHDLLGDYACGNDVFGTFSCDRGWKGKNCAQEVNPCDDEPCHPDGAAVCKPLSSVEYTCYCHENWRGDTCNEPPMNLISVPGTFASTYPNMNTQSLQVAGIESILKDEIEKLVRSEAALGHMVQEIKDWAFTYNTSGNDTVLEVAYTTVITVIHFEVWQALEEPTRRKRSATESAQQAEPDFDATQTQYVENKFDTVNGQLNDPASASNQAIQTQVPNHQPQAASTNTQSMSVTTDLDACDKTLHNAKSPCQNGGVCKDIVGAQFSDTNIPVVGRDFECECGAEIDYLGDFCDVWANDCETNACKNGGTCNDGIKSYTCTCRTFQQPTLKVAPFTGMHCDTVDNPCENGGILEFDSVSGKPVCGCTQMFEGELCSNEKNVDACGFPGELCKNGGTCIDKDGGFPGDPEVNADYECECSSSVDHTGDTCEDVVDDCVNHKCLNGAICVDGVRKYTCECADFSSDPLIGQTNPKPYSGDYCETLINPCNNGNLHFDADTSLFVCQCDLNWEGDLCQLSLLPPILDGCDPMFHLTGACQNGGLCVDSPGGFHVEPALGTDYSCNCDAVDFGGDVCETHIDDCDGIVCETWQRCVDGTRKHACVNEMCSVELDKLVNLVKLDGNGDSTTTTDTNTVNHLDYCNNPFNPINEIDTTRRKACSDVFQVMTGYRFERAGTVLFDASSGDVTYAELCPRNCKTCVSRTACNAVDHQATHKMESDAFESDALTINFCTTLTTECSYAGSETFTDCSGAAFRRNGEIISGVTDAGGCTTWAYKKLCPVKCGGCRHTHSICSKDIGEKVEMLSTINGIEDASFHDACSDDYWTTYAVTCETTGRVSAGWKIVMGSTTMKTEFDGLYSFAEVCPLRCDRCVKCPSEYDGEVTIYNRAGEKSVNYDNFCAKRCTTLAASGECACDNKIALSPGHYFSRAGKVIATEHDNQIKESYELCPEDCGQCSESVVAGLQKGAEDTKEEEKEEQTSLSKLWGKLSEASSGAIKNTTESCPTKSNTDDVCQSLTNTMPKFSIDLTNPGKSDFCEWLKLMPSSSMWPFGACSALKDCILASIEANTFDAQACIEGIFTNAIKASKETFKNVGQKMVNLGQTVLDLTEDLACNEDPSTPLEKFMEDIPKLIEMFTNIGENVKDYIDLVVGTWKEIVTDMAALKDHISILISKDTGFTAGTETRTRSQGVFATFLINDIKDFVVEETSTDGSTKIRFKPTAAKLLELVKRGEYGYWEAIENGQTTDAGTQISGSGTVQMLQGRKTDWGGFGYTISMGFDLDIIAAEAGGAVGLVFAAIESDAQDKVEPAGFLGFMTSIGVGFGPSNPLPVSLNIGCAHAVAFNSSQFDTKCATKGIDDEVKAVAKSLGDLAVNAWDLAKKCTRAAFCDYAPCESPLKNFADGQKQCLDTMFTKCLTWDNFQCIGGVMKKVATCAWRALAAVGECLENLYTSFCSVEGPVDHCVMKPWKRFKWLQRALQWICTTVTKCFYWAVKVVGCVRKALVDVGCGSWKEELKCATDLALGCTSWATCQLKQGFSMVRNIRSCAMDGLDAMNMNPFKALCPLIE